MSVAFCLPVGSEEPPCSTLFSYLYAEHSHCRGLLQFLTKDDLIALASTCKEAHAEIASLRWNKFIHKVKGRVNKKECKASFWADVLNPHYKHIDIQEFVCVMEIEPNAHNVGWAIQMINLGIVEKQYIVELIAKNRKNPTSPPVRIFVKVIINSRMILFHNFCSFKDTQELKMNLFNFSAGAKVKDVLIDNRKSHVMTLAESSR